MSVESDLRDSLLSHAPLAALVQGRIRPDKVEKGEARPYIVYLVKRTPQHTLDNVVRTTLYEFRMQCWADKREDAEDVADALEAALAASALEPPNGIPVDERFVLAEHDLDMEGTEVAFTLWHDA